MTKTLIGHDRRRITPHLERILSPPPRRNSENIASLPRTNRPRANDLRERDEAKFAEFRLTEKRKNFSGAKIHCYPASRSHTKVPLCACSKRITQESQRHAGNQPTRPRYFAREMTPSSGLLAVAYSRLGMRPAR